GWPLWLLAMFATLVWINLTVLFFNLVPAFPLDGGRMLRSLLWALSGSVRKATLWASLAGRVFAWFLIAVGLMNLFAGHMVQGIWMGLIGMFLERAAQSGYQQVLIRQVLAGKPVARFMSTELVVVPGQLDLRHWVDDYVYRYHRKMFPVTSNGHVEGIITTQALAGVPRGEWEQHSVGEVMSRDVDALSVSPGSDALQALGKMQRLGSSRLLV